MTFVSDPDHGLGEQSSGAGGSAKVDETLTTTNSSTSTGTDPLLVHANRTARQLPPPLPALPPDHLSHGTHGTLSANAPNPPNTYTSNRSNPADPSSNRIPNPNPSPSVPSPSPSLEHLLGRPLHLTLRDNRLIVGTFTCVDRGCNIILKDAEEFLPPPNPEDGEAEGVRRNRELYWPRSEPFGGWGVDGDGEAQGAEGEGEGGGGRGRGRGRGVGMVGVKGDDVVKIEVGEDIWKGMGGQIGYR